MSSLMRLMSKVPWVILHTLVVPWQGFFWGFPSAETLSVNQMDMIFGQGLLVSASVSFALHFVLLGSQDGHLGLYGTQHPGAGHGKCKMQLYLKITIGIASGAKMMIAFWNGPSKKNCMMSTQLFATLWSDGPLPKGSLHHMTQQVFKAAWTTVCPFAYRK